MVFVLRSNPGVGSASLSPPALGILVLGVRINFAREKPPVPGETKSPTKKFQVRRAECRWHEQVVAIACYDEEPTNTQTNQTPNHPHPTRNGGILNARNRNQTTNPRVC